MDFIARNFKWLMLVSGVLTATMFYGLFAPQEALQSMFGASFDGQLQSLVIRSWSALVGLMGVLLIYGALSPQHRVLCAVIAALSKAIFVTLVMIHGQPYLPSAAAVIVLDLVVIASTLLYLLSTRRHALV
jgi:CHASE2 domain-containing sensor protein